jgi:hypothetical protein
MLLGFFVGPTAFAQNSVPAELGLEDLFGVPSDDEVVWLANFLTKNPNWAMSIDGNVVTLHNFRATVKGKVEIPRLATMIESVTGEVREQACDVKVDSQPLTWFIEWDASKVMQNDDFELMITMKCHDRPVSINQVRPIAQRADGFIRIAAHQAVTKGTLLRYEPQAHKNTVGYWTKAEDSANWTIDIVQGGRFSVAILAGCGEGQGGSTIDFTLSRSGSSSSSSASVQFVTKDTGHFQNFQWQSIGEVTIEPGLYSLKVQPKSIAKQAALDIREITLSRQAK